MKAIYQAVGDYVVFEEIQWPKSEGLLHIPDPKNVLLGKVLSVGTRTTAVVENSDQKVNVRDTIVVDGNPAKFRRLSGVTIASLDSVIAKVTFE